MPMRATGQLLLAYLGFVSLGLPDAVIGVTWPSIHRHFGLPPAALASLLTATVSGYLVSSLYTGRLLQVLGVGRLLAGSSALIVVSLAGYTLAPSWGWFVACGLVAGLGSGAIDSALNAYAARHFSARHMAWLHGFWGVGATLGAMAAAAILAQGVPWRWTYACLALAMAALTLMFAVTWRAWQAGPTAAAVTEANPAATPATMGHALRQPLVWGQMVVFFLYTGTEMVVGTWVYTLALQYRGLSPADAGFAVTLYWSSLTAGRFLIGFVADAIRPARLLGGAASLALLGGLTFVLVPWPWLAVAGLALLGASLAPLYPGLMSQTPRRLGALAEHAVGFQVGAATLGQVALPSLGGLVLQTYGAAWLNGFLGLLVGLLWLAIVTLFLRGGQAG